MQNLTDPADRTGTIGVEAFDAAYGAGFQASDDAARRRLLAGGDPAAALEAMNAVLSLQEQHDLELQDGFDFEYAQVAYAAGRTETAIAAANQYLVAAGREGEFYREALELLDSAEVRLEREAAERRRAEAAQRRADAERQRAAARQRARDALVQRQLAAAARPLPRDELRSGGLGPEMVTIASGRFQYRTFQGRGHLHWVEFARPFAIAKYEVTRGEFATFVDRTRCRTEARDPGYGCRGRGLEGDDRRRRWNRPGFDQTDRHPVTCVSIRDAVAYARWLSDQTGHSYRLPSAAEWQYAARAGSEEAQLFEGTDRNNNCGRANLEEDTDAPVCADGVRYTTEAGSFPPNPPTGWPNRLG